MRDTKDNKKASHTVLPEDYVNHDLSDPLNTQGPTELPNSEELSVILGGGGLKEELPDPKKETPTSPTSPTTSHADRINIERRKGEDNTHCCTIL